MGAAERSQLNLHCRQYSLMLAENAVRLRSNAKIRSGGPEHRAPGNTPSGIFAKTGAGTPCTQKATSSPALRPRGAAKRPTVQGPSLYVGTETIRRGRFWMLHNVLSLLRGRRARATAQRPLGKCTRGSCTPGKTWYTILEECIHTILDAPRTEPTVKTARDSILRYSVYIQTVPALHLPRRRQRLLYRESGAGRRVRRDAGGHRLPARRSVRHDSARSCATRNDEHSLHEQLRVAHPICRPAGELREEQAYGKR